MDNNDGNVFFTNSGDGDDKPVPLPYPIPPQINYTYVWISVAAGIVAILMAIMHARSKKN